jgi:hypothetical protein
MKTSKTFNPSSDHQKVRLSQACQRSLGLTGRFEYRYDTLSNAGSVFEWFFSLVLLAHVLDDNKDVTPFLEMFHVFLYDRLLAHVWFDCRMIWRLVGDRVKAGHGTVSKVKG